MPTVLDPLVGVVGLVILLLAFTLVVARGVLRELGPGHRAAGWSKPLGLATVVLLTLGLTATLARLASHQW